MTTRRQFLLAAARNALALVVGAMVGRMVGTQAETVVHSQMGQGVVNHGPGLVTGIGRPMTATESAQFDEMVAAREHQAQLQAQLEAWRNAQVCEEVDGWTVYRDRPTDDELRRAMANIQAQPERQITKLSHAEPMTIYSVGHQIAREGSGVYTIAPAGHPWLADQKAVRGEWEPPTA